MPDSEAGGDVLTTIQLEIKELKDRLQVLETAFEAAKRESAQVLQLLNGTDTEPGLLQKTDKVYAFVTGTDHVFGFCRKHWRTAIKFGAGVVTAYGIGNPHVQAALTYVTKFIA